MVAHTGSSVRRVLLAGAVVVACALSGAAHAAGTAPALASYTPDGPPVAIEATRADHERRSPSLSSIDGVAPAATPGAQDVAMLEIESKVEYVYDGTRWLDGVVFNPYRTPMPGVIVIPNTNVCDAVVTVTWLSPLGAVVGTQVAPVEGHILRCNDRGTFTLALEPPPGADHYQLAATGTATPLRSPYLYAWVIDEGTDASGVRWYTIGVENRQGFAVRDIRVSGWERARLPDPWRFETADVLTTFDLPPDELQPGEWFEIDMWGFNTPASATGYTPYLETDALEVVPYVVHRFRNLQTGTHFYTASEEERKEVIRTLGSVYVYEGPSYRPGWYEDVCADLYRFYNLQTGTHFYTMSEVERQWVNEELWDVYVEEGPAYPVYTTASADTVAVYRFYNTRTGTHFYTAGEAERDDVIARLGRVYRYEGIAFYAHR